GPERTKGAAHWLRLLCVVEPGVYLSANGDQRTRSVQGLADRLRVVRFVASRPFDGRNPASLQRLVRQRLAVALRGCENVRLVVRNEVRRVGRRDVGERLHRSSDAHRRGYGLRLRRKYMPPNRSRAAVTLVGLNLSVERGAVFGLVQRNVFRVIVRRKAGEAAVGENLIGGAIRHGGGRLVIQILFAVRHAVGLRLVHIGAGIFFRAASDSFGGRHGNLLLDGKLASFRELARHLLEFFDAGKLVDVLQPEADQKVFGRLVENRPPDDLLASGGRNQLARHQRAEHAAGVDPANLRDLGRSDRLLVRDDGERLERLQRQLQRRLEGFYEASNCIVVLRLGGKPETAGDLANLQP